MGDFVASLVPLRDQELTRGDIVYERVAWGEGEEQSKLNRLRVLRVDRAAAFCEYFDRRRKPRLIPFHELRMEPKALKSQPPPPQTAPRMRLVMPPPESSPPPAPPPAPKRAGHADLDAWLEMGRGLIDEIGAEKQELEGQLSGVQDELETMDRQHRERIEALEREMLAAKHAHQEARRYHATRAHVIRDRLEKIGALEQLRKLVGT